jgi:hypothetical protein
MQLIGFTNNVQLKKLLTQKEAATGYSSGYHLAYDSIYVRKMKFWITSSGKAMRYLSKSKLRKTYIN